MLILGRREGEIIRIGDEIIITVASIRGNYVRLAIEAPKSLGIYRQEIYERMRLEQQAREGKK